jgi:hypothetical protein
MKTLVIVCAIAGVLALPTAALAQSSMNGYSNVAGVPAGGSGPAAGGGNNAPVAVQQTGGSGSLPFTGLEIGLVAGGGVLLLGAGLMLRRLGTRNL